MTLTVSSSVGVKSTQLNVLLYIVKFSLFFPNDPPTHLHVPTILGPPKCLKKKEKHAGKEKILESKANAINTRESSPPQSQKVSISE